MNTPLKPPCTNYDLDYCLRFNTHKNCMRTAMHRWQTAAANEDKVSSITVETLVRLAEEWATTMMTLPLVEREDWLTNKIDSDLSFRETYKEQ